VDQPVIQFPEKLQCLFLPKRYKVLYGGRGGAKSWGIARALLLQGLDKPLRVLCAREFQNSMQDSVHKVLSDQIVNMGLSEFYDIQKAVIKGVGRAEGTEFSFEGIRHNVTKIKSYEGVDVCWVEEANLISKNSWEVLIPTIRKEGSEIWLSFNPELETDETYQRFVKNAPPNAFVIKISWRDNPWFPQVLKDEMDRLKELDYDSYLNVWEGECKKNLEGAVFAQELRQTISENRIMSVPYDSSFSVDTIWDLGYGDATTIWFRQKIGFEYRYIDYFEGRQKPLSYYLQILQAKKYIYGIDWLPHDAKSKSLGTGMSIEEILRNNGRKVRIVPKLAIADRINAARTIFPQCYFDKEKTETGVNALMHYRYALVTGTTRLSDEPYHDWASDAADSFCYSGVVSRYGSGKTEANPKLVDQATGKMAKFAQILIGNNTSWMG